MPTILSTRYKDASKTSFKSSTRLECMMQDCPKTLPPSARVGFTVMEPWLAYAPLKNNPEDAAKVPKGNSYHSATSGEMVIYRANSLILKKGVPSTIEIGPRDVWSQSVVVSRRDGPGKQGKVFEISLEPYIKDKLDDIQTSLLEKAKSFHDSKIVDVRSCDKLKIAISQGKWARGHWSASDEDELKVKEETVGQPLGVLLWSSHKGLGHA